MVGEKDRLTVIMNAVLLQRERQSIADDQLLTSATMEGSCIGQTECANLFQSLTRTRYPSGDWIQVLRSNEVMELDGYLVN